MQTQTVSVRSTTTTRDKYGDSTTVATERVVPGAMFEPQQATERTDANSPGVVTPAKFYLPEPVQLDADDEITDAAGTAWQVIGGSSVWGDQTEVPVQKASAV